MTRDFIAYVYILSGDSKRLYIGVTSQIEIRMKQHKENRFPDSFTARYNIKRLVYFERFGDINEAIAREKQLKRWSRIKKIALIVSTNPDWCDLSADWGRPIKPFDGKLRPPTTF
jgi:putative endonuclease